MGVIHIFGVEVRIDGDSKVYQHHLARAEGDEFCCGVFIKQALSDALYEMLEARMDNAPIIEAEPVKHGQWERRGFFGHNCSNCGALNDVDTSYCPNCGAKMDLEVDDGHS